jgi:hypothetical protein
MIETDDLVERAKRRLGSAVRGKYRVDSLLGVGGMASVYAATHRNQTRFGIKLLHAHVSMHQALRSRFLREGCAAQASRRAHGKTTGIAAAGIGVVGIGVGLALGAVASGKESDTGCDSNGARIKAPPGRYATPKARRISRRLYSASGV